MATVLSSNLNSTTGWTEVDTSTGTITATSGGGRNFIRLVGSGTTNQTGIVFDTSYTRDYRQVIYWDHKSDGNSFCKMGLRPTAAITESGSVGIAIDGTSFKMFSGVSFTGSVAATAAWYNFMLIEEPTNEIMGYVHLDDGTAHEDITNWTYIGRFNSPTGTTRYFMINAKTADNNDVDTFEVTDNGYLTNPAASLIYSHEIDDYTGITSVETGGTNTITTGGGRTFSRSIGSGAWNATGIYTTSSMATGAMGHEIFVDYRGGIDNPNSMTSIRQDASMLYATATAFSLYQDAVNRFTSWNSIIGISRTFIAGTWKNVRFRLEASGRMNSYYHEDDGTLPWELSESDWTWISLSNSMTFRGASIHFSNNHLEATTNEAADLDRLYYTSDGTITSAAGVTGPGSGSKIIRQNRRNNNS